MKKMSVLLAAGLVASTMLAGCGANPAASSRTSTTTRNRMPVQGQVPANAQPGARNAAEPSVQQVLAAVNQANMRLQGFSATVDTYDKGPSGTCSQTLKIAFKKPTSLKIDIVKDQGGNDGVQALWTGGAQLQVKPKFPPMTVSLGVTDQRLTSKNGWTIKDTGVAAIQGVLLNPASQIKMIGNQNVEGKMLTLLEVHSPASPKGSDHEVIGIDPNTAMPGFRAIYNGQTLLYKLTIKSMVLNAPASSALQIS
jgi:outer membrane lipoprotein-sorting protein